MAKEKTTPTKKAPAKPAAKPAPKTRAVAPRPQPHLPFYNSMAARFAADAGSGMEGTDKDSFAIPRIVVLQQLSPQCTRGKPEYREDAEPGMFYNTVTGELMDGNEGIIVLPCAFQRRFIQWGPRGSDRAGFKGEWLPEAVAEARVAGKIQELDGALYLGEPNPKKSDRIEDTRNHFFLVLTDEGFTQALFSLKGTQIKKSKQLMALLAAVRVGGNAVPTWVNKIRLTTQPESNDKGSWYGVRVEADGINMDDESLYTAGKAFYEMVISGQKRADYSQDEMAHRNDEDDEDRF